MNEQLEQSIINVSQASTGASEIINSLGAEYVNAFQCLLHEIMNEYRRMSDVAPKKRAPAKNKAAVKDPVEPITPPETAVNAKNTTQDKAESPEPEQNATQEPDETTTTDTTEPNVEHPTVEELREALRAVNKQDKATAKSMITECGVKTVSDIKPEQRTSVIEACELYLNGLED